MISLLFAKHYKFQVENSIIIKRLILKQYSQNTLDKNLYF